MGAGKVILVIGVEELFSTWKTSISLSIMETLSRTVMDLTAGQPAVGRVCSLARVLTVTGLSVTSLI